MAYFTKEQKVRFDRNDQETDECRKMRIGYLSMLRHNTADNHRVFVIFQKSNAYRDFTQWVTQSDILCFYNSQANSSKFDAYLLDNSIPKFLFMNASLYKKTCHPDSQYQTIDTYVQIGAMYHVDTWTSRSKNQQLQCIFSINSDDKLLSRKLNDDETILTSKHEPHYKRLRVLLRHNLVPVGRYDEGIVECRMMDEKCLEL